MTPYQQIELHSQEFTKSEKIIMDYVIKHMDVISSYPITTVAEKCKVSKSALLRFCQKCGFRGYSEFKYEISRYLQSVIHLDTKQNDTAGMLLDLYIEQIQQLHNDPITASMNHISELLLHARNIKIYGVHETGLSAQYFAYRLFTLGIDSEAITNTSIMAEKATMTIDEDVNVIVSLSAQTTIICDAIRCALEQHSKIVLITQNDRHKFLHKVDETLVLPTFQYEKRQVFLDSQALVHIAIDLLINNLARHIREHNPIQE